MNILELDEFEIIKQYKNDDYYKFVVKAKDEPIFCSLCSAFHDDVEDDKNHFKLHDTRTRTVADVEFRGRKVILEIQQRRFHCSFCGKNFTEFFESIAPNDKVTAY
jgi:transposase